MSQVARDAGLSRESLYKALSFVWEFEEGSDLPIQVDATKCFRHGIRVMLMRIAILTWELFTPQCGINLCHNGFAWRNRPSVERPKMNARTNVLADVPQPWNTRISGFSN